MDLVINHALFAHKTSFVKILSSIIKVVLAELVIMMMDKFYADNVIQVVSCVMEKERAIALAAKKMFIDKINLKH